MTKKSFNINMFRNLFSVGMVALIAACSSGDSNEMQQAEANSGTAVYDNQMVVAANPYAAKAGLEILMKGGSAVDAAIAVETVLSLVEPQSSGIGGSGFMLHFDPTKPVND